MRFVVEIKLKVGPLEGNLPALAELLLQVYYMLMGYSGADVHSSILGCLCDTKEYHYFRLVCVVE